MKVCGETGKNGKECRAVSAKITRIQIVDVLEKLTRNIFLLPEAKKTEDEYRELIKLEASDKKRSYMSIVKFAASAIIKQQEETQGENDE